MIIPHLAFSHMIADYLLQTEWLVQRKARFKIGTPLLWDGILLHGLIVWSMSLLMLNAYLPTLWPHITLLAIIHTLQDALKVWITPRLPVHPIYPYLADQAGHLVAITIFQVLTAPLLTPPPTLVQVHLMAAGAALIAVTRFYEVTWWSNYWSMLPYMERWRLWGYLERTLMLALSAAGWWLIAPLCIVPRLIVAHRQDATTWRQKKQLAEILLGMAFSVILGLILRALL